MSSKIKHANIINCRMSYRLFYILHAITLHFRLTISDSYETLSFKRATESEKFSSANSGLFLSGSVSDFVFSEK